MCVWPERENFTGLSILFHFLTHRKAAAILRIYFKHVFVHRLLHSWQVITWTNQVWPDLAFSLVNKRSVYEIKRSNFYQFKDTQEKVEFFWKYFLVPLKFNVNRSLKKTPKKKKRHHVQDPHPLESYSVQRTSNNYITQNGDSHLYTRITRGSECFVRIADLIFWIVLWLFPKFLKDLHSYNVTCIC